MRLFTILLLATPLTAQIPAGQLVIATRLQGPPATQLLVADPASGASQPLSRFANDNFPPLAVLIDPINGDLVLAVEIPAGSRILRMRLSGLQVVSELVLAELAGHVTGFALHTDGAEIFASVEGGFAGIWHLPRRGGAPAAIPSTAQTHALSPWLVNTRFVLAAESGTPTSEARLHQAWTGHGAQTLSWNLNSLVNTQVSGLVDDPTLGTGPLLTTEAGEVYEVQIGSTAVRRLPIQPSLGPGSLVSVRAAYPTGHVPFRAFFLGGAAHPFVKTVDLSRPGPYSWSQLVGPLPGDPVDFDVALSRQAHTIFLDRDCGGTMGWQLYAPWPTLGNQAFRIELRRARGRALTIWLFGIEEPPYVPFPPPPTLPNGCALLVDPLVVFPTITDSTGNSWPTVPIPNGLPIGARVFVQVLQDDPLATPFPISRGLCLVLGV